MCVHIPGTPEEFWKTTRLEPRAASITPLSRSHVRHLRMSTGDRPQWIRHSEAEDSRSDFEGDDDPEAFEWTRHTTFAPESRTEGHPEPAARTGLQICCTAHAGFAAR